MGLVGRGHPTTPKPRLGTLSQFVGDGVLDVPGGRKIIAHLQTIMPYDQPWNKSHYGICVICPRNGQDRSLQIVFRAVANDLCSSPAG